MKHKPSSLKSLACLLVGLTVIGLCSWWWESFYVMDTEIPKESFPSVRQDAGQLMIPSASPLRQALAVAAVTQQTVAVPFELPAVVEADPAKLVRITTPLSGRIVSLGKQIGEAVKAGDVLFSIDSGDLAQARSDAAKAHAALVLTKHNLDRQRELDRSEIAAKRDLDQAQSEYDQAASELARANARLAQLGAKSGVGRHVSNGHILTVRSPISGRVVELSAATGGYWNDTTAPLMTVADLSHVFVTASAQEKDLARVYVGQDAAVNLDAYDEPLAAKVRFVNEMLDLDTRTTKVRMVFDNRNGRLKPGMFARVTLVALEHPGIVVPASAIVQSGFNARVFVEVAPWQFESRVVKVGAKIGEGMEVVSGLTAGERIVVSGGVFLND